ncbi:hypothetical protein SETIT_4G147600v2 [Setaria italica]|uniref:Ubiquitin-like protease family profile domain-containing protein n=4 Tax=Setaria italica TaxID=4555 RepID=A0A368QUF3_SETIT|nr:ubiquitin-like-specific protease 1D isoform X1 [Setaria italica]RCV21542.1 hypothetical protein SETIT_4G147600v2 [Setaria italica]
MPMAAVSREEVPCGEAGVSSNAEKEERERADAELRHLPDRELQEKKQRLQGMVTSGIRLPDGGRKLEATIDAIDREQDRRQARGGMARATGGDGCERIVRSRCAESSDTMKASHRHRMDQVGRKHGSGFPSDPNRVSKADFQYSFGMDEKVDVDISSLEITTRSRNKPNTSIENEGKLCKEEHSCKPSSLPTNSFHEEMDVDTSSNVEKISPDDASNNNGHNGMCEAAPTPSRKRKGADPANFSMRLRSRKEEVVVLDGDAPHPDSVEETSNNWDAKKLYYPSREHPNSVEISSGDIRCLQPESLLSSPIMNFYIMHLQGPMLSIIRPRGDYHIFNTYFFRKLEAMTSKEDKTTYFLKLRRWWKGIDIFEKAYVLLPVHAETHWSLVIICMPAKEDQTGPIILHLDSLKFHSSRLIFNVISRFLKEEWNYLNENVSSAECPLQETVWKNFPRKIEKKAIEVPQQENDYDCGLFVLYYMQRFIQEAPERLQKKDLSMFGKRWFRPEEPSQLRGEIRRLLQKCREAEPKTYATELCVEAEPNDVTQPMSSEHLQETVDAAAAKDHALIEVEETCGSD